MKYLDMKILKDDSKEENYTIYIEFLTDKIKDEQTEVDDAIKEFTKLRQALLDKNMRFSIYVNMIKLKNVPLALIKRNISSLKRLDDETYKYVKSCCIVTESEAIRQIIKITSGLVNSRTKYDVFNSRYEGWKYLRSNY